MAYTARELIKRAWYLSGIVSRNLNTISGDQMNDGLHMLNSLLNFKQVDVDLIPYYTYIKMNLVPDQEFYFLEHVAQIETLTFNLDTVRFSMQKNTRDVYYGSPRADNVQSLPFNWHFERCQGGGTLGVYFKPQDAYPIKMMAKIFLTDVTLDTDMTNVSETVSYEFINTSNQGYDTGYIEYLRYALAQYMCSEYGIVFNPQSKAILDSMERKLMYVSSPDLRGVKASILNSQKNGVMTWAQISLGQGWTPS